LLAKSLGPRVQGIAIHPYYDGIDVPEAIGYVRAYAKTWADLRPDAEVYVTEHARWPSKPKTGKWQDNWYQATGLGGAISTSDFMLAMMPMSSVVAANWHALSAQGPWQLVRSDRASGRLFPSPVYWGLRVLRDAYLDQVIKIDYTPTRDSNYSGGYDQRIVAMRSSSGGAVSLLAVNRSPRPVSLVVDWGAAGKRKAGRAELRWISGSSVSMDNTAEQPQAIVMNERKQAVEARSTSTWCLPARSVFSVLEPP
jgi:hypothetical protein